MTAKNQLTQQEARSLFDYRDGMLWWKQAGSGRRRDLRAVTVSGNRAEINIGGVRYQAKYVVWNWHRGVALSEIRQLDDRDPANLSIENLIAVEKNISAQSPLARSACPCCAQHVPAPPPEVITFNCGLSPMQDKILSAVWAGRGLPVPTERIFDAMYEDDPDGGPEPSKMYLAFKVALSRMRKKLKGSGYSIVNNGYGRGYRLVIGQEEN